MTNTNTNNYEARVQAVEAEGITRSDAQGIVDAEIMSEQRDAMTDRFDSMEEAVARAEELTASTGEKHEAYWSDFAISPYVAFRLPQIGDPVSKEFNGDSYPCGEIVRISLTYSVITTSTDERFHRVSTAQWKQGGKGGAFSLTHGHRTKMNPHF